MPKHRWIQKMCGVKDCDTVIGSGKTFCMQHNTYTKRVNCKINAMKINSVGTVPRVKNRSD